jgi:CheY-like chemotaxis protein
MSHEIRTPLTSVIGFAEMAKESGVSNTDRIKAFETILSNGRHLLGIINDLLDLSKVDFGAMHFEMVPFSPVQLVENLRILMEPRLAEKGLPFKVHYNWDLPENITSDSLRLMQILVNLTSNALKFTEYGEVEVQVRCDRENETLHFSVADTGIGLTSEQMTQLFKPFSQAEVGTTRRYGGTGLGLSISRQLIEKLGGAITISSQPDIGSTFSFYIKTGDLRNTRWISNIPEQPLPFTEKELNAGNFKGKVLIADDAADNRDLLKFTLRKTNLELTLVENGEEALKASMAENFDLILLDMQMPLMDGYTAAREIRKNGITVPIVAFTANAMKHDVCNCLEAGCTSHLPKPFTKSALFKCLELYLAAESDPDDPQAYVTSEILREDPDAIDLVISFVEGLCVRVGELSEAITVGDHSMIYNIAHKIAGSAGLYGYPKMSDLAANLQKAAKRQDLITCEALYPEMTAACNAILIGINKPHPPPSTGTNPSSTD